MISGGLGAPEASASADSAIAKYEAHLGTAYWSKLFGSENSEIAFGDALVLAGIHKRLGERYEAKGDRQRGESPAGLLQ